MGFFNMVMFVFFGTIKVILGVGAILLVVNIFRLAMKSKHEIYNG